MDGADGARARRVGAVCGSVRDGHWSSAERSLYSSDGDPLTLPDMFHRGSGRRSTTARRSGLLYESGDVIDEKYRIESILGSGGMGAVVLARHVMMNHRVAIKILKLADNMDEADAVVRFLREARATARIESDHVVRVTDVAALPDGTPYMVMEYLEGEDLSQVLEERHQLPIEEATDYVLQACEGLAHAHAAGVIHRDLKPSNLFRARRPNGTTVVKVIDFGTSKLASRPGETVTMTTNGLVGTPIYMAPEQICASPDIDSRADVWSLGLVLYELLSGELPFKGATIPEVCLAITGGEPKPISRVRADIPPELQAILRTCMAKDRSERYPTVVALAHDLAQFAPASARVHADRASAVLNASRPAAETGADTILCTGPAPRWLGRNSQGGILIREPDTERLVNAWPRSPAWRRRAWLTAGVACAALAAILGAIAALDTASSPAGASARSSAATTAANWGAPQPPSPIGTGSVRAVSPSDESIPARHASAARGNPAPEPARSTATAPPAPAPSASANPAAKNEWKWGKRN